QIDCEFRTELFDHDSVQQLLDGFAGVLKTLEENPEQRVSQLAVPRQMIEQAKAARRRQQKHNGAIASTFTAEPLEAPLNFWMKELDISFALRLAPYDQVFQQLLDPASLLATNPDGTK